MGKLHHLAVGCGDASCIVTDETFLVDCHRIDEYAHLLPESGHIRGVFITHQHRDHYSGLEFLRKMNFTIDFLVYSPYDRRYGDASVTREEWSEFAELRDYFHGKGTELRAPFRQNSWDKPYWSTDGVRFWVLGPEKETAQGESREIHDACLVVKAHLGNRACTFTGDASDTNLRGVASLDHICGDILHASHHGSIEGADLGFIKKCNPAYTVISTEVGVHENVPHPTALARYRDNTRKKVYRTDKSGSLKWTF